MLLRVKIRQIFNRVAHVDARNICLDSYLLFLDLETFICLYKYKHFPTNVCEREKLYKHVLFLYANCYLQIYRRSKYFVHVFVQLHKQFCGDYHKYAAK